MSQTELPIDRFPEDDRNAKYGGRSFYFFDFDDNIAILKTPVFIFNKKTGQELELSSREFAEAHGLLGKMGPYSDFHVDYCDIRGSFRRFRDQDLTVLDYEQGKKQDFLHDLDQALALPKEQWQGPSWSCFYHAVYNKRPIAMITARGHHPETIKAGMRLFVERGFLPHEPNILGLYPVSHPDVRDSLSNVYGEGIASLKKAAIHEAFKKAVRDYGLNPYHRFGISDDDPKNIQLMSEAFLDLKRIHPMMSFFIISTSDGDFVKSEIFLENKKPVDTGHQQLPLFRSETKT